MELSFNEVVTFARGEINAIKAVVCIRVEKGEGPYTHVDASLILKRPNWLQMRMYKFGMPVGSLLIKDNVVYEMSGKGTGRLGGFGRELYYSIFWWDDVTDALMYQRDGNYVIKAKNRVVRLDGSTLLPESQEVVIDNKKAYIIYGKPKKIVSVDQGQGVKDVWYPSILKIKTGKYMIYVKIEKLLINPSFRESDFDVQ
jgi:hypothetical protein